MANGKGSKRRPATKPGLYEENYAQIQWRKSPQLYVDVCKYAYQSPKIDMSALWTGDSAVIKPPKNVRR